MGSVRGVGAGRPRWVVLFAVVLLAVSAVPVLAEDYPPPPAPTEAELATLPGAEDVREAIDKAEREEEDRKAWLASPEAVRERQESRLAFADLDATAARELLSTVFAEQLAQLNSDPARVLSDAQLLSSSADGTSATIKDEGNGLLLESGLPVRTEDEEGDLRKVDLSLEETATGFETENALVDVQIPDSAEEPIQVGDRGVSIKLAGADEEKVAQPFGDKNVLAVGVLPDTDMLISPIATGVEIFNVLRSERSPETFRFQVDVPAGAELRASGDWGAEVAQGEKLLTMIREPVAVDAQGTDVPVDLQVEGNSLVMTVDHREGDYSLPILLDPILENNENWIYGQNHNALDLGVWAYNNNGSWWFHGSTHCIYECFGPGGAGTRGLYVSLEGQRYYGANQFGQWSYSAPNSQSYISSVTLGAPYVRADHGCNSSQYPQPHDYFGVWGGSGWNYVSVGSANYPGGHYTLPFSGQAVVFGLGTGGGIPWIPCWRDLYAGGAHVWLDDNNWPSVYPVTNPPTKWISATDPVKVVAQASDAGLGVKNVVINSDGSSSIRHIPVQNECAGTRRSPCLTGHTATFNLFGADFREGRRPASVTTYDATGKYSNPYYFETKMDATAPQVTLDGQLAKATNEVGVEEKPAGEGDELSLPVYNLKIEAKDGVPGGAEKDWRSGVKDIEIYLDEVEQEVTWSPSPSCAHSCPMTKTYQLILSKLTTSGEHDLEVKVRDFVGNVRERKIEFEYFPATGMKDEYVMHYFPLPDGQGNEAEEEHPDRPELAVNVMNGNLVYREKDIEVEGAASVDLEVERYYNSMLPDSENTEWGDGWTLAQTPDLKPIKTDGSPIPNEAEILDSSGAIEDGVGLPTEAGAQKFDPELQATLTKKSSGGYELRDETGESATSVAFDKTGQTEALLTEGLAKVDYTYEGGDLIEIAVSDPATFAADPAELEIPEPEPISVPTYAGSFGSYGSADGQLKSPGDVAVDASGNLLVVDKSNNRIQKFSPKGQFLGKLGGSGTADGQFNRPTSIAIAANGNLLVADAGNGRIQRFSATGAYLSKFGAKGTANGQFAGSGPEGVAIDAAGNIWVSDTYGGRLQKFNSAGEFIKVVGSKGSGSGQLGEPTGIDVDPSGNVWVADWQNNRVAVFDSSGEFLGQFGSVGSGDGQFSRPDEIEIDKLGNVWVGDQNNNRVQQFDLAAQFKGKFGSYGSGAGQFSFTYPMGIATDSKGRLWIADVNNHRVQEWLVPIEKPTYAGSFGSLGSANGQLKSPGDVAIDYQGNLWVADRVNNRIQKFSPQGEFLSQFGVAGSGDGQLNAPSGLAIDTDGDIWVADRGNHRVQQFGADGKFLSKFGVSGTEPGQLLIPEGIAVDLEDNIWVSDGLFNRRVQKFDPAGQFIERVGAQGAEPGQLGSPRGIDVGPGGKVWIADWQNHRVSVFDEAGEFLFHFGGLGTGPGQFNRPYAVEVNRQGKVWVSDQENGRIQQFDQGAQFVAQFGSKGSGEGQFSLAAPTGIAADSSGRVWVADVNNNRIQQWLLVHYAPAEAAQLDLRDGDPQVEVETAGGLVSSVTGNAAGEHTYAHDGDFLVSHAGPQGETLYEKDAAERLTKVTLPNGTWASIAYHASDGRVQSVTVAPGGSNPKTTYFAYSDEPRRTTVTPPGAPQVTYDIGADGSVFKWRNAASPPTIEPLRGTLYTNRETPNPVSVGNYHLTVEAFSAHGIASIQVIANGNQLVDEETCEEDFETPQIECEEEVNEWVTETGDHAPGILNLEVLVTDRIGNSAAERFWINIPQPPPPPPAGFPVPPKFNEIKKFREEYGLEVVFPVANEIELNERIFNLIGAWHNPNSPAGQVARASWERWGMPLRPADVAEMEYREWLYDVNAGRIDQWVQATNPSSYAGYYIDHAAGGIMRVGFLDNQAERLEGLKASLPLVAGERLQVYPTTPSVSYLAVQATSQSVSNAVESNATLRELVVSVSDGEAGKIVRVGTPNVAQVESTLDQMFGSNAPIVVEQMSGGNLLSGRYRTSGRMRAGDNIIGYGKVGVQGVCTAGFGAYDEFKVGGKDITRNFVLTAGHCFRIPFGEVSRTTRTDFQDEDDWAKVGLVKRNALTYHEERVHTDGEAIWIQNASIVPRGIFGWSGNLIPTEPAARARVGDIVCFSGARTQTPSCGSILAREKHFEAEKHLYTGGYWVKFETPPVKGDSGAPVWSPNGGASIGLVTSGRPPG